MRAFSARSISSCVLPTPGKNYAASYMRRGCEHALQFPARDNIEAGAALT